MVLRFLCIYVLVQWAVGEMYWILKTAAKK